MSIETLKNAGQILMMTAEDLQSVFSSMMATFLERQKENESKQTKKEDLLSSAEVRQLFNIQKCTLCHWVKARIFEPYKVREQALLQAKRHRRIDERTAKRITEASAIANKFDLRVLFSCNGCLYALADKNGLKIEENEKTTMEQNTILDKIKVPTFLCVELNLFGGTRAFQLLKSLL